MIDPAHVAGILTDLSPLEIGRNVAVVVGVVFWLATASWVVRDARRRVEDPWLVWTAAIIGLVPPFLGPIIYLFFRSPETLLDRQERELEIRAMEERLGTAGLVCPVCRGRVDASFLICPVCTTRLKHACTNCSAPMEPIWQACPYCSTPAVPTKAGEVLQPLRRHISHAD